GSCSTSASGSSPRSSPSRSEQRPASSSFSSPAVSWGRVTVLLSAALLAVVPAETARADGDPASDFLLSQKVFLPFDAQISPTLSEELVSLASAAGRQGDPIRVAVIATPADLGSVTALWKRPRQYARFLASEVSFAYHGRLLIVMPQGLGTYQLGHSST